MTVTNRYTKARHLTSTDSDATAITEKPTEFTPTPRMLKFLDWFSEHDFLLSVRKVFEIHGSPADRVDWYRWHDRVPGFSHWWLERAEHYLSRALPRVHARVLTAAAAKSGCAADRKLAYERFDPKYQAQDSGQSQPATVQVDVVDLMRAMIAGLSAGVQVGADSFSSPVGGVPMLPVLEAEAIEVEETQSDADSNI